MEKRTAYLTTLIALASILTISGGSAEVNVPGDILTIQGAIDAIVAGDETSPIIVAPDTYEESITLAKDITLRGSETARTILNAVGSEPVISVSGITNSKILNFTFISGSTGIEIDNSNTITIANNAFEMTFDNATIAVNVTDSSQVEVTNNTFNQNGTGIQRIDDQVTVVNNIFSSNGRTILPDTITTGISFNCYAGNSVDAPLGTDAVVVNLASDVLYADDDAQDFHLQENSPCIDVGDTAITDIIDGTRSDIGSYGGGEADVLPYPVQSISVTDVSTTAGSPSIQVDWSANLAYLVTHSTTPGGYRVLYDSDVSGEPYSGTDAQGSTQTSPVTAGNVTTFTLANLSPAGTVPAIPVITQVLPSNQTLDVFWNAVSGASGYTLHYGESAVSENQIDVGNVTDFTLSGLQNDVSHVLAVSASKQITYFINVVAVDSTGNATHESGVGTEASVPLGASLVSAESVIETGTPEQLTAFPELTDDGCFIATAANGDENARQVVVLREFRDRYLLTNTVGGWMVSQYYKHSPPVARYLHYHPVLKPLVRALLSPLVVLTLFLGHTSLLFKLLVVGMLSLLTVAIFKHRHRARQVGVL